MPRLMINIFRLPLKTVVSGFVQLVPGFVTFLTSLSKFSGRPKLFRRGLFLPFGKDN